MPHAEDLEELAIEKNFFLLSKNLLTHYSALSLSHPPRPRKKMGGFQRVGGLVAYIRTYTHNSVCVRTEDCLLRYSSVLCSLAH